MAEFTSTGDGIISDEGGILRAITESMENNSFLGIWAPRLGSGVYICKVENIRDGNAENDKVVILREKNLEGINIHTHVLYLKEIEQVHHFKNYNVS